MVYAAFSGGPDSCCLASTLKEEGYDVKLLHFDHGWPLDKGLPEKCQQLAKELELPITILKGELSNNEESARHARYSEMAKVCTELYVGHSRQDTVETAVYNLLRNPSMKGISSLTHREKYLEKYSLTVVRPLLGYTRDYTINYCRNKGINFHEDPYNRNTRIPRVLLREEILPSLQKVHKGAFTNLLKFIGMAKEYDEYMEEVIEELWPSIKDGHKGLSYPLLIEQKKLIQKHIWMKFLRTIDTPFSQKDIQYLTQHSWEKPTRNLKTNIKLEKKGKYINIVK